MTRPIGLGLAATLLAAAPAARAQSGPEAEVLEVVRTLLAVLETKDTAAITPHVDSTTRFTLLRPAPGGTRVVVLSGQRFLELVTRPEGPRAKELIRNPEVRIDGDLATVWTEYQVVLDGAVDHCGYDAFHLARVGGTWKVINVSDSFRNQNCGPPWPQPE